MSLFAVPLTLKQANELVAKLHRHHKPVVGHRFSIGARLGERLVGAVIVGRPVARALDQYSVMEVTRLVTDGTPQACSFLYSRAARAAEAMGASEIRTSILREEPGTSLRAAGWICLGQVRRDGVGWNNREGRRTDQPTGPKVVWNKTFSVPPKARKGET